MQAVILAGGKGTRLLPLTKDKPKSMVEINGVPFIDYQIKLLMKNKIDDVFIIVKHLWKQIYDYVESRHYPIRIRYLINEHDDAYPCLRNSKAYFDSNFLLLYGDTYLDFDYESMIQTHYSHFLSSAYINMITMAMYEVQHIPNIQTTTYHDIIFYKKLHRTGQDEWIDAGISIIEKQILRYEKTINTLTEFFTDASSYYNISGYKVPNRFYEIGNHDGLEEFRRYINDSNKNSI
jgi:NDP-sugar pyrophosphorylase family protein